MYKPKSPAVDDAGELELRVDQQVIGADGSVPNVEPTEVILTCGGDVSLCCLIPAGRIVHTLEQIGRMVV